MTANIDLMLEVMSHRPRMFCSNIETGRNLIFLLEGAVSGAFFPGRGDNDGYYKKFNIAFRDYVYRRFNREPPSRGYWVGGELTQILLEEFGHRPFAEVCTEIGDLLRGVRSELGDLGPAEPGKATT